MFIYWKSTAESKVCRIFFAQFFPFILLKFTFKYGVLKVISLQKKKQPSCKFRCVAWHVFLLHVLQCMNSEIKFTEFEKIKDRQSIFDLSSSYFRFVHEYFSEIRLIYTPSPRKINKDKRKHVVSFLATFCLYSS